MQQAAAAKTSKGQKLKSENERKRRATSETTYSPQHDRLQNALHHYLSKKFGKAKVRYESDFVDLAVEADGETTFFEVKIAPTPKRCIRDAIGQVLEYAVYPDQRRALRLVVVGDGRTSASDVSYLRYLRDEFKIPLYYRRWDWDSKTLGEET